jgi:hypothetical protein
MADVTKKTFLLLRSEQVYADLAAAKTALASLSLKAGEPALAYYTSGSETLALLAVGNESGKTIFYNGNEVEALIKEAADKATTVVAGESGVTVVSATETDGHVEYTVSSNLTIKYVAATGDAAATIQLVDGDGNVHGSVEVSDIIGNGVLSGTSYDSTTGILTLTFNQANGVAKAVEVDLKAMLDLDDVVIGSGSTNYLTTSTTQAEEGQFVIDVKTKAISAATASTETGLADAADVKAYVDSAVAGKNVTAEGDDYVAASASDNKVTVKANVSGLTVTSAEGADSTIAGSANSLVDGNELASKVGSFVNARISEEIAKLDVEDAAVTDEFVTVVSEADGKISVSRAKVAASGVTATAIASGDTTVAVTGETVADQIASIAKSVKAVETANTLSAANNGVEVKSDATGTTVGLVVASTGATADLLSITDNGLEISDTYDCGTWA